MHQRRLRNLLKSRSLHLRILTFALCLMSHSAKGAPLKAGVAKVDITPPTGVLMWGYFDRLTPSKATLDPLYARVLVLEAGETRLALVALDLGRAFGRPRSRACARRPESRAAFLTCWSWRHTPTPGP